MNEQVTVVARIRAKPGLEGRVRGELYKLLAPTRAEAGCINYDMHESPVDPRDFLFYENWTSAEHLDAHLKSPHIKAWFDLAAQLLEANVDIARWRIVH